MKSEGKLPAKSHIAQFYRGNRFMFLLSVLCMLMISAINPVREWQASSTILGLRGMARIMVTYVLEKNLLSQCGGIPVMKNGWNAENGTFDELITSMQ